MTKTALLHIGTAKTGTTSIQQCLAAAQAEGGLESYSYPIWNGIPHHNRLGLLYYAHGELAGSLRQLYPVDDQHYRHERDDLRRVFFDQLRAAGGGIIVTEVLSGFEPARVAQLRADLESVGFDDFRVVLYVRDPADFYLSRTQQALKASGAGPANFLSRVRRVEDSDDSVGRSRHQLVMDPATFIYDFRRAADTWEQVFPGSLNVRRYPSAPGYDVVGDFAGVMEEQLGLSLKRTEVRSNATLSAEGMQILQDYRESFWPDSGPITPDALRLAHFLRDSVGDVPQTKPVLKPEVAQQIRANHHEDAEVMKSRYGLDLGLANLLPVNPGAEAVARHYRVDEIVEAVNPVAVNELLLRIARSEFTRVPPRRTLARRVAGRVYRTLPPAGRPRRLVDALRRMVNRSAA